MTDHDALAALPLTPEEIHRLALAHERGEPWGYRDRERILAALTGGTPEAGSHRPDGAHWPSCRTCGEDWPCSAATHAAGVRVTGDAAWPYLPDQPHSVVAVCDGCGANVTLDDEGDWVHVDAATAPEADRIGQDKE